MQPDANGVGVRLSWCERFGRNGDAGLPALGGPGVEYTSNEFVPNAPGEGAGARLALRVA